MTELRVLLKYIIKSIGCGSKKRNSQFVHIIDSHKKTIAVFLRPRFFATLQNAVSMLLTPAMLHSPHLFYFKKNLNWICTTFLIVFFFPSQFVFAQEIADSVSIQSAGELLIQGDNDFEFEFRAWHDPGKRQLSKGPVSIQRAWQNAFSEINMSDPYMQRVPNCRFISDLNVLGSFRTVEKNLEDVVLRGFSYALMMKPINMGVISYWRNSRGWENWWSMKGTASLHEKI